MKCFHRLLFMVPLAASLAQQPAATPNFGNVPVPPPKVKTKSTEKAPPMRMVIDSETLDFDKNKNVAFFRHKVRLRSQNMDIDCEELEVHFKAGSLNADAKPEAAPKKPATPPPGFDPTKPNASKEDPKAGATSSESNPNAPTRNIEIAYARGKGSIVTLVKRDAKGDASICKSGEAVYEDKTGKVTLKIFPEVEQAGRRLSANDRNTNIFLDSKGQVTADGPIKTTMANNGSPTPPADADKPKPANPAPATSPAPKPR